MFHAMFVQLLLLQLITLEAAENQWSVKYSQQDICALNGSAVFMNASYTQPAHLTGKELNWVRIPAKGLKKTDLCKETAYSDRVQCVLGKDQQHSLRLSDVRTDDENTYSLRMIPNSSRKQQQLGLPGVTLRVTALQVEIPNQVMEGNTTVLTCNTTCNLTDTSVFVWYKNRRRVDANCTDNILTLQSTRLEDAGAYSCAVRGYEHLPSSAQTLNVMYRPKNISVSISPPGEVVEGSTVTLTCSGDANPPVQNCTWYKAKKLVGKEKTYTITGASSEIAGEYKCKCSNEVGFQYSAPVTLDVAGGGSKLNFAAVGIIIACGILLAVSVVFLRRKQRCCWSEERLLKQDEAQNAKTEHRSPSEKNQHDRKTDQQDEVQYAVVTFHHSDRPDASEEMEKPSVIYSNIK